MQTFRTILLQHIVWRHQLLKLARADIVKTYSGSALGWAWAILKPAVTIFVFWFAFDIGLRIGRGQDYAGYPFILWFMAGMIPWFFMDEMLTEGANALRDYHYLVTKMRFPIATIPTFVSLSKLLIHLCLIGVTVVFFLCYGYAPDRYLLQLPIYMLLMLLFFIAWSQFACLLGAMSRDFYNLVGAMTQALFWLSGILYDVHTMDVPEWLRIILLFNPITFVANGYRNIFIYKVWIWEEPDVLLYFLIVLCVMTVLATRTYAKLYREVPDVL
ncbi:MAG: ABC transporter permease [Clostridiales Family XIII bacterium]|jgi:teichoic acid transport system permease protein|nr:ABC transporter permease [Clostridiales Family XIII bacterium]